MCLFTCDVILQACAIKTKDYYENGGRNETACVLPASMHSDSVQNMFVCSQAGYLMDKRRNIFLALDTCI